jgi:hypothetical protein
MNVAVGGVGTDRLGEYLGNVCPELVHCRHDDMTRVFIVELLDALSEIGFDDLDPDGRHVRSETALLGQHRLALDQRFGAVIAEDAVDNLIVLGGVPTGRWVVIKYSPPSSWLQFPREFCGTHRHPE